MPCALQPNRGEEWLNLLAILAGGDDSKGAGASAKAGGADGAGATAATTAGTAAAAGSGGGGGGAGGSGGRIGGGGKGGRPCKPPPAPPVPAAEDAHSGADIVKQAEQFHVVAGHKFDRFEDLTEAVSKFCSSVKPVGDKLKGGGEWRGACWPTLLFC